MTDSLYLRRSLLAITGVDGHGAMPGNSSFCALGFRCEVKCNVHPYVCPSAVNFQALGYLSGVHEILHKILYKRLRYREFHENRLGENRTSPKLFACARPILGRNPVYKTHNNSEFSENRICESHTVPNKAR